MTRNIDADWAIIAMRKTIKRLEREIRSANNVQHIAKLRADLIETEAKLTARIAKLGA